MNKKLSEKTVKITFSIIITLCLLLVELFKRKGIMINIYLALFCAFLIGSVVLYCLQRVLPSQKTQALGEMDPDSEEYGKAMYITCAENQQYQSSLEWFARYLEKQSVVVKPVVRSGQSEAELESRLKKGTLDEKINVLKSFYEKEDSKLTVDYLFALSNLYYEEGAYEQCLEILSRLLRLEISMRYKIINYMRTRITLSDHIQLCQVNVLAGLRRFKEAEEILKALGDRPRKNYVLSVSVRLHRANLAIEKKDSCLARHHLDEAVKNDLRNASLKSFYFWMYEILLLQIRCDLLENDISSGKTKIEYLMGHCASAATVTKAKKLYATLNAHD